MGGVGPDRPMRDRPHWGPPRDLSNMFEGARAQVYIPAFPAFGQSITYLK